MDYGYEFAKDSEDWPQAAEQAARAELLTEPDELDARFEEWYAQHPRAAQRAENRARGMEDVLIWSLFDRSTTPDPSAVPAQRRPERPLGVFGRELKRLMFLFTDPQRINDTIDGHSMTRFIGTELEVANGNPMLAAATMRAYRKDVQSLAIPALLGTPEWTASDQRERFWLAYAKLRVPERLPRDGS